MLTNITDQEYIQAVTKLMKQGKYEIPAGWDMNDVIAWLKYTPHVDKAIKKTIAKTCNRDCINCPKFINKCMDMGKILTKFTRTLEISNKALIKKVETLKARREKREKYYYDLMHPTDMDVLLGKAVGLRDFDYKRLMGKAIPLDEQARDALLSVKDILKPKEAYRFIKDLIDEAEARGLMRAEKYNFYINRVKELKQRGTTSSGDKETHPPVEDRIFSVKEEERFRTDKNEE